MPNIRCNVWPTRTQREQQKHLRNTCTIGRSFEPQTLSEAPKAIQVHWCGAVSQGITQGPWDRHMSSGVWCAGERGGDMILCSALSMARPNPSIAPRSAFMAGYKLRNVEQHMG